MDKSRAQLLGLQTTAAAWLAVFCLFGYRSTFSVLLGPIQQDMGWSFTQVSLGYSLMMVVYAVTAFASGLIVDRWGTRPCYFIGAVFGALGFYVTSFVESYLFYLLSYALLAGIGTGMLWVTAQVSVRRWYVGSQYATKWGLAFLGAPAAQVVLSLWVSDVLMTMDWRVAMQGLAVVIFAALVLATFLAKRTPEYYGSEPFGAESQDIDDSGHEWSIPEAYKTAAIWGAIAAFLGAVIGEFLIWTQVTNYWVSDHGFDLQSATNLYVAIGVAGLAAMPLMGIAADRVTSLWDREVVGRKVMLIFAPVLGIAACLLLLIGGGSVYLSILASILFAIYWAIEPGGVVGYVGAVYGRASLGRLWGLATLIVMGIGPALGSFMGGYLYDLSGAYTYSIIFASVTFFISAVSALVLPLSTTVEDD